MPVMNYFEDNYIGRLRLAPDGEVARSPSRFPIEMWSVYQRTLDGEARTNNFAEAAHRKLQREFGVDHPSLWRFFDGLRRVQHSRDCEYSRFAAGHEPPKKRRKYVEADGRILEIVRQFYTRETLAYLRWIANNFRMEAHSTATSAESED